MKIIPIQGFNDGQGDCYEVAQQIIYIAELQLNDEHLQNLETFALENITMTAFVCVSESLP